MRFHVEMISKAPAVRSGSRTHFNHLGGEKNSSEPSPPSNPDYWKGSKPQFTPSNSEPNLQQPEQQEGAKGAKDSRSQKEEFLIAQNPQQPKAHITYSTRRGQKSFVKAVKQKYLNFLYCSSFRSHNLDPLCRYHTCGKGFQKGFSCPFPNSNSKFHVAKQHHPRTEIFSKLTNTQAVPEFSIGTF